MSVEMGNLTGSRINFGIARDISFFIMNLLLFSCTDSSQLEGTARSGQRRQGGPRLWGRVSSIHALSFTYLRRGLEVMGLLSPQSEAYV